MTHEARLAMISPLTNMPSTNFARIEDATAVPYLGEKGRESYTKFVQGPSPRAFAIASNGAFGYGYGSDSTINALANCRPHAQGKECRVYAQNDSVVWKTGN